MTITVIIQAMLVAAVVIFFATMMATIRYRITVEALEVLTLGCVTRRVRLKDIEEVHRRGALIHESWSGPKFWNAVTIRRRTGLFRNFVISPDDPDRFVAQLLESVRNAGGTAF